MKKLILLFAALLMVLSLSAYADNFPKLINYQGMLTRSDEKTPVTDDQYNLTFKIYGSFSGNDSLWTEHHLTVQVTNGLFNVILGSVTPLDLPFDAPYWLGIKVGDDPELSPRIQFTSVGYAFRAQKADTANVAVAAGSSGGWVDDGAVVRLETGTDWVGIGTTSPMDKLHIEDGSLRLGSIGTNEGGQLTLMDADDQGGWEIDNFGGSGGEILRMGFRDRGYNNLLTPGITIANTGNVGIGTYVPQAQLHLADIYSAGGRNLLIGDDTYLSDIDAANTLGIYGQQNPTIASITLGSGGGTITGYNGNICIGTTNPSRRLTVRGNILLESVNTGAPIVELGEGLDYAEGFDVSDQKNVGPGSVLVIDPSNPGKLFLSNKPYDNKVAGIVSGAKDLGSGVRLGVYQFDCNVALAGRVYCNVDATEAGVEPGDLLTTSAAPGYAMKVTDYARAQGAILGKAMQRLEKGQKGQILVLVTLQ
jgi:hypothetical protein